MRGKEDFAVLVRPLIVIKDIGVIPPTFPQIEKLMSLRRIRYVSIICLFCKDLS